MHKKKKNNKALSGKIVFVKYTNNYHFVKYTNYFIIKIKEESEVLIPPLEENERQYNIDQLIKDINRSVSENKHSSTFIKILKFFHCVTTRHLITENIDFTLNIISYAMIFIFQMFMCIQYTNLVEAEIDFPNILASFLIVKQINIIIFILTFVATLTPWASYYFYKTNRLLSKPISTVVLLSLEYYPMIFSPVLGFLAGYLAAGIIDKSYSPRTAITGWLINGMMFILMLLTNCLYHKITSLKIVIYKGHFSPFSYSLTWFDHICKYLFAGMIPLRSTNFINLTSLGSIIMIIYGFASIIRLRNVIFTTFSAEYINRCSFISFLILGIISSVTSWIKVGSLVSITLSLIGLASSVLITYLWFVLERRIDFNNMDDSVFDSVSFALKVHRRGIIISRPEIITFDFLQKMCRKTFSFDILPDVIRASFVCGYDLSKLVIPFRALPTAHMSQMQFMAFQTQLFKQMLFDDSNRSIDREMDRLTHSKQVLDDALERFWTEGDDDHRSIEDLAALIEDVVNTFRTVIFEYPSSQRIAAAWTDFANNTMYMPTMARIPEKNILKNLLYPGDTLYGFVNESKEIKEPPMPISLERFFDNYKQRTVSNVHIISIIIFAFFIGIIITVSFLFIDKQIECWGNLTQSVDILLLAMGVTDHLVTGVDALVNLPKEEDLQVPIQVGLKKYNIILQHITPTIESPVSHNVMSLIPHMKSPFTAGECTQASFHLLFNEDASMSINNSDRFCYIYQTQYYVDNIVNNLENDKRSSVTLSDSLIDISVMIIFLFLSIASWIVVQLILQKKEAIILKAVRRATAFKELRQEYQMAQKGEITQHIAYAVLIICGLAGIIGFSLYTLDNVNIINDIVNTIVCIAKVITLCQQSFSFASLSLTDLGIEDEKLDYYKSQRNVTATKLFNYTDTLSTKLHAEYFEGLPGIEEVNDGDNESVITLNVRDFSLSIKDGDYGIKSIQYLYARYLLMSKLSILSDTFMALRERAAGIILDRDFLIPFLLVIAIGSLCFVYIEIIIFAHDRWVEGAFVVIKGAMASDKYTAQEISDIMTNQNPDFVGTLPFPAVIVTNEGNISAINTQMLSFIPYTKEQVLGQPLDIFIGSVSKNIKIGDKDFEVFTSHVGDDNIACRFIDVTELNQANDEYTRLTERLTPNIDLPMRARMYILMLRSKNMIPPETVQKIGKIEGTKFTRIMITSDSYTVAMPDDMKLTDIIEFASNLTKAIGPEETITALSLDVFTLFNLVEGALTTFCAKSGSAMYISLIYGNYSHLYSSESLIEEIKAQPNYEMLSPLILEKNIG